MTTGGKDLSDFDDVIYRLQFLNQLREPAALADCVRVVAKVPRDLDQALLFGGGSQQAS